MNTVDHGSLTVKQNRTNFKLATNMDISAVRGASILLRHSHRSIPIHSASSRSRASGAIPFINSSLRRSLGTNSYLAAPPASLLSGGSSSNANSSPASYFPRPSLPANTIVRFVPQQTAWIVERMGKFNRILEPGLAILIPFLDRIAYVKSLKEAAMEIPSQSAITADNVTLELDGVLYTRVIDAYRAR